MKDFTDIVVVLDRSGSMTSCLNDTIGGFNSFIKDQLDEGDNASVSLYQFDNHFETVYEGVPIREVPPLKLHPRGGTALLDAMGRTIGLTGERLSKMPEEDRPDKVLVIFLTDGGENASKEFKKPQIAEMIKRQKEVYNWTFLYIGADFDAMSDAHSFGLKGYSVNYQKCNSASFYNSLSASVRSFRKGADLKVES